MTLEPTTAWSREDPSGDTAPVRPPIPGGIPPLDTRAYMAPVPSGGDDRAVLQALLGAVPAGSEIILQPGVYKLAAALQVSKSVVLNGRGVTTLERTTGCRFIEASGSATELFVKGLRFDGNSFHMAGVFAVGLLELRIDGCDFWEIGVPGYAASVLNRGSVDAVYCSEGGRLRVFDTTAAYVERDGVLARGTVDVQIVRLRANNCGRFGAAVDASDALVSSQLVTFDSCSAVACGAGGFSTEADVGATIDQAVHFSNLDVIDCGADQPAYGGGIILGNKTAGTVNGCSIVNMSPARSMGRVTNGSPTVTNLTNAAAWTAGNHISGRSIPDGTHVVSVDAGAGTLLMSSNATPQTYASTPIFCNSYNAWRNGLVVGGNSGPVSIAGLTVKGCGGYGLSLNTCAGRVTASALSIYGANVGVYVYQAPYTVLSGGTIDHSMYEGVTFDTSIAAEAQGLRIIDSVQAGTNAGNGLRVAAGADCSVIGCDITGANQQYGLAFDITTLINGFTFVGSTVRNYATKWCSLADTTTAGEIRRGVKTFRGPAAPTALPWLVGDRVENSAPASGGFMGWVCVAAGTPGTWKGYGAIA